jgi:hypothetical protein
MRLTSALSRPIAVTAALGVALVLAGCDVTDVGGGPSQPVDRCSINESELRSGGIPQDGFPALTDPAFVHGGAVDYLESNDRVIGLEVAGVFYAVPHNILWWHEIVNLNFDGLQLALTYCPLTGSSMAFDRSAVGGAEFGVSGLLYRNNLVMYDRRRNQSLWPQMNRAGGCGPASGTNLAMYPVIEMSWAGWRTLFPEGRVVSDQTGFNRTYTTGGYPYGDYEEEDNPRLAHQMPIDERRPPKERVLGVPGRDGGAIAFPFGILDQLGPVAVAHAAVDGEDVVVLWSRQARAAMAYAAVVDGEPTSFEVVDGQIRDALTSSAWSVDGLALDGPQQGHRLAPVPTAYVAFWFAWAAFNEGTEIWSR